MFPAPIDYIFPASRDRPPAVKTVAVVPARSLVNRGSLTEWTTGTNRWPQASKTTPVLGAQSGGCRHEPRSGPCLGPTAEWSPGRICPAYGRYHLAGHVEPV